MTSKLVKQSVIPGFGVTLGFTLAYLCLIVLIPLSAAFLKTFTLTWQQFLDATTTPRVMASYRLTGTPAADSTSAAIRPAGPPPMIATSEFMGFPVQSVVRWR